jgi:hypothetical protein
MKNTFTLCLVLFSIVCSAQIESLKVGYQEFPTTINGQAFDSLGNIYYSGTFKGELKIKNQVVKNGSGLEDIFLVKTNTSGEIIYTKTFGGGNSELVTTDGLAFSKNNLYLAVRLTDDVSIQSTPVTVYPHIKAVNGQTNAIIKLDTSGNVKWISKTSLSISKIYEHGNIIHVMGVSGGGSPVYSNEQQLLPSSGYISLVHLMLDTSGKVINYKRISPRASRRAENVYNVQFFAPFSDGKICMLLKVTAGVSIEFGNDSIPLPPTWGFQILIKTDTSYKNFTYKILNDRTVFLNSDGSRFSLDLSKEDSIFMVVSSDHPQTLNYDGLAINPVGRNILVSFDSSLKAKRVVDLGSSVVAASSNAGQKRLVYKSINSTANGLFFTGSYIGVNESPFQALPKNEISVTIFPNTSGIVDLNGASKTFALHTSRNLSKTSFAWIGEHSNFEISNPDISFNHTVKDSLLIFSMQPDNVWNPYVINSNAKVVSGAMLPNADRPDVIKYVEYLPDGSRIILGVARGKTALDSSATGIKSNQRRTDAFIARVTSKGEVKWYKRFSSTLTTADPRNLVVRNSKAYFLINYSSSINDSNYIKAGLNLYSVSSSASMLGVIDSSGELSIVSLENAVLKDAEIVHFNFWSNGELAVLTSNKKVLPFSSSSPLSKGFYLFRVNAVSKSIIDGRKFTGSEYLSPLDVQIDSNDILYLSAPLVFGTSPDRYSTIGIHDSTKMIGTVTVENNIPFGLNTYGLGIMRMTWNAVTWYKRTGGINGFAGGFYSPSTFLQKDKLVFMAQPGTVAGTNSFNWDNSWFLTTMDPKKSYFFKIDAATGYMDGYKSIDGFRILNAKKRSNQSLLISGQLTRQTTADTIAIGFDGGVDALALGLSSDFKFTKSYRLASPYYESMNDMDIYKDSMQTFAYSAQTATVLKNNRTSILATDFAEDAFLATQLVQGFAVLPLKIIAFNAIRKDENVNIEWTVAGSEAGTKFVVQRSKDGYSFTDIKIQNAFSSSSIVVYDAKDILQEHGRYFYRLKIVSADNKSSYSKTVMVLYAPKETSFYYNPTSHQLNIFRNSDKAYQYAITDVAGRKIQSSQRVVGNITIALTNLSAGHYTINVYEEPFKIITYKFIK